MYNSRLVKIESLIKEIEKELENYVEENQLLCDTWKYEEFLYTISEEFNSLKEEEIVFDISESANYEGVLKTFEC